jgi:hypothetical protein
MPGTQRLNTIITGILSKSYRHSRKIYTNNKFEIKNNKKLTKNCL